MLVEKQSTLREEQNTKKLHQLFLHSLIVIQKSGSGREMETFQVRFWSKWLKKSDRGTQRRKKHINCFDQGFKCFARYLVWGWPPFVSLHVKHDLAVHILLVLYIHFFTCFAYTHRPQKSWEAHGRFWLQHTGNTEEEQIPKQSTSDFCNLWAS